VLALLVLAMLVGGALQRVTGMGFGLVAGPFIVLIVGPLEGVLLVNLAGATTSLLILGRVARSVDWGRYVWLVAASVAVSIPAALLMRGASASALEITVGAIVVVAMTLALVTNRLRRGGAHPLRPEARWPLVLTGSASGFGSVAAGIGGPPLAIYSVLSGWDPRSFAATAQPFFMTNALAALTAKLVFTDASFPGLSVLEWALVIATIVVSLLLGELLAKRISGDSVRRILVVLAYLGGLATLVHGLTGLS